MAENKTVKYHIPHRGIYMYSHVHEGKTEMIVLNSTGSCLLYTSPSPRDRG